MNTRTCENPDCGKPFVAVRKWQRFCGDPCRLAYHATSPNPLERELEFSLTLANPNPSFKTRKDGDHYFVEFELQKDEWEYFVDPNVNRQGMLLEATCMVAHHNGPKAEKPKGGPLAQLAGMLCGNEEFWNWLRTQGHNVTNETEARAVICSRCEIDSRVKLDHDGKAARIFHEAFRLPFMNWRDRAYRERYGAQL